LINYLPKNKKDKMDAEVVDKVPDAREEEQQ
jgi:hypothetical protein